MMTEDNKLDRLINILRESKPLLDNPEDIEEKVIERILQTDKKEEKSSDIFDYLFSWVYVSWVRKSLIAASVLIVIIFGYQQSMILKRMNDLAARTIFKESLMTTGIMGNIDDKLLLYKLTDRKPDNKQITISERQMKRLINSINELQLKYNELIKLIEENPDLKKFVDEKMTKNNMKKLKL